MAAKSTVSQSTGVFAVAFCFVCFVLGYSSYLIQIGEDLAIQAEALAPGGLRIRLEALDNIIMGGGFAGTLTAVVLNMADGLALGLIFFAVGYLVLGYISPSKQLHKAGEKAPKPKLLNGECMAEIQGSDMMIALPHFPGQDSKTVAGIVDRNPYHQIFYRIKRLMPRVASGVEMTPHRKLHVAIYSMLSAHPNVPASIGTHHADASLFEHSKAVSVKVREYFQKIGRKEPLAELAGLAHDLDKLLAYKETADGWVKNVKATHHNRFAAYIVSTQPEFRHLPAEDQNTLVLALRYYHDPDQLPIGTTLRTEQLVNALRISDGYTIQEEKAAGIESIEEESLEIINTALQHTIKELNINSYISSNEHAGGWTTPALEYVLIPMSTVLEKIGKHLTSTLVRKLQLDHETRTFSHPAASLIVQQLKSKGLLMESYKEFSSEDGLYDCRIGNTRFRAVLMVEKRALENELPGLAAKWESCKYRIRITGATKDNTLQGESDVEE